MLNKWRQKDENQKNMLSYIWFHELFVTKFDWWQIVRGREELLQEPVWDMAETSLQHRERRLQTPDISPADTISSLSPTGNNFTACIRKIFYLMAARWINLLVSTK